MADGCEKIKRSKQRKEKKRKGMVQQENRTQRTAVHKQNKLESLILKPCIHYQSHNVTVHFVHNILIFFFFILTVILCNVPEDQDKNKADEAEDKKRYCGTWNSHNVFHILSSFSILLVLP